VDGNTIQSITPSSNSSAEDVDEVDTVHITPPVSPLPLSPVTVALKLVSFPRERIRDFSGVSG